MNRLTPIIIIAVLSGMIGWDVYAYRADAQRRALVQSLADGELKLVPRNPPQLNCACPPSCECCTFPGAECCCRTIRIRIADIERRIGEFDAVLDLSPPAPGPIVRGGW